jgi:amino acid transporter
MASEINPKSEAFDAHDAPRYDEKQGTTEPIQTPKQSWALRNGLTLESFKAHDDYGKGTVELSRDMKPRHLNMIAIGGRLVHFLPHFLSSLCNTGLLPPTTQLQ